MRYINDDAKIERRFVVPAISQEEFKNKFLAKAKELSPLAKTDFAYDVGNGVDPVQALISILLYEYCEISRSKEFSVDHENIDFEPYFYLHNESEASELLGLHTIDGLTFCGMTTGGDWEYPVYMLIYWDGEDFKSYIPRKGNLVNLDTMTAFGSEGDEAGTWADELSELGRTLKSTYQFLGVWPKEELDEDGDSIYEIEWTKMYAKKYGFFLNSELEMIHNWEAIKEDISGTFGVKEK